MNVDTGQGSSETHSVIYATFVRLSNAHDQSDDLVAGVAMGDDEGVTQTIHVVHEQMPLPPVHGDDSCGDVGSTLLQLPSSGMSTILPSDGVMVDGTLLDVSGTNVQPGAISLLHAASVDPRVSKGPFICQICQKKFIRWSQLRRHLREHEDDKPFRCRLCSSTFNVEENLRLHEATHGVAIEGNAAAGGGLRCPDCGRHFSRVAGLKAHVRVHEREESLMCAECGDEFALQSQLDKHMVEHREEPDAGGALSAPRIFSCRQCTSTFSRTGQLREHMKMHYRLRHSLSHRAYKRHVDRTSFQHRCSYCHKKFAKPSQLKRHERIHTGERPFPCQLCHKAFNQKGALQIHMQIHNESKPYKCDFCYREFGQKGNLRAHIERVHKSTGGAEFACTECSCVFRKLGSLNAHIGKVHGGLPDNTLSGISTNFGGNQSSFVDSMMLLDTMDGCSTSGGVVDADMMHAHLQQLAADGALGADILQQALENSGLNPVNDTPVVALSTSGSSLISQQYRDRHLNSTTVGSAPLATVAAAGSAAHHMAIATMHDTGTVIRRRHIVHKVNGVRWHQCAYCVKEFKKPSDLVRHVRIHTHEKPFKCTQCFRSFTVKSTLTAHTRTHTGVKSYKCDVCHKLFSTHGSLKIHVRLHTGAKPFACPKCDRKFRTSGHLKSHTASHARDGAIGAGQNADRLRRPRSARHDTPLSEPVPEVPLPEPILITENGRTVVTSRGSSQLYNAYPSSNNGNNGGGGGGEGGESFGERPYKCPYCSRGFKKSSHMKQHMRGHTGEKPYKCQQCMRSFVSSGVLKAHLRTHTGLKSYRCQICDNMFTTNGSLKRHMSTHSEMRPFMCPYCQKTFKTAVNCKKHMKTHRTELATMSLQPSDQGHPLSPGRESHIEVTSIETLPQEQPQQQQQQPQRPPENSHQQHMSRSQHSLAQFMLADVEEVRPDHSHQTIAYSHRSQQPLTGEQILEHAGFGGGSGNQATFGMEQHITGAAGILSSGLSQNYIDSSQRNLNQLNFEQTHFGLDALSGYGNHNSAVTVSNATAVLPSTNMSNILQTRESLDVSSQSAATGQNVMLLSVDGEEAGTIVNESTITSGRRSHRCTFCSRKFKKTSHLKQHMRSHTGEKPFKCSECGRDFVSSGVLKAHMRTHTGAKEFACTVCTATFTTNGSLTRHMTIHSTIKPFTCSACGETHRTAVLLRKHEREQCRGRVGGGDMSSDMLEQGDAAEYIVSPQDEPDGEEQGEEDDDEEEDETTMLSSSIASDCNASALLGEASATTGLLAGAPTVVALHCTRLQSGTAAGGNIHVMELHHAAGSSGNNSASMQPPPTLSGRAGAMEHVSVSERVLEESTAEKDRVSEMRGAEERYLELEKLPKYSHQCVNCPKSFKKPSDLMRHLRIHTGEKPFACHVCSRSFTVKSTLDSHMKTHTGSEKTFKCHICDSLFATKGTLKVHMRLHTGAKPFKCPHCEMRFRTSGHRKSHIQSHLKALPAAVTAGVRGMAERRLRRSGISRPSVASTVSPMSAANVVGSGMALYGNVDGQTTGGNQASAQLISIDPSLLQSAGHGNLVSGGNMLPVSLAISDGQGGLQGMESSLSAQIIPGLESIQLQLTGNLTGPGIHITGLDPSMVSQTVQIDMSLLAHLQQHGNISLIATQAMPSSTADRDLVQKDGGGLNTGGGIMPGDGASDPVSAAAAVDQFEEVDDDGSEESSSIVVVHNEGSFLTCTVCSKSCHDVGELAVHMASHGVLLTHSQSRNAKSKNRKCDTCGKMFEKPSQLERHVRIHTGDRPFACSLCNKTFNQKNALETHLKSKHKKERPFRCPYCQQSFSQKGNMKTHIKKTHQTSLFSASVSLTDADDDEGADCVEASDEPIQVVSADAMVDDVSSLSIGGGACEEDDDSSSSSHSHGGDRTSGSNQDRFREDLLYSGFGSGHESV